MTGSILNRDIIVIGGSSGATAPLKEILGRLPTDLPAAVFVVLHVPAQSIGILSTIASAASRLPVVQAESGMVIEQGRIYLAVPITTSWSTQVTSCWDAVRGRTWRAPRSIPCFVRRPCNTGRV